MGGACCSTSPATPANSSAAVDTATHHPTTAYYTAPFTTSSIIYSSNTTLHLAASDHPNSCKPSHFNATCYSIFFNEPTSSGCCEATLSALYTAYSGIYLCLIY